ncbi:MAG: hypothetical protein KJ051_03615 [Thermoleophilia bacterium]|nr:hypothetical protein [Thermoleophilia bacterium]
MLSSARKGAIAESAIAHAATKLGIVVAKPLTPERYDLIFDLGARLLRLQCKWAARRGGVVIVRCYSSSRARDGLVRRFYSEHEIDAMAAYCPDTERCYFLTASWIDGRQSVQLRVEPARNNQAAGVVRADVFEFEALDWGSLTSTGP